MKFWDSSAIIPLCIEEDETDAVKAFLNDDNSITTWWGTQVECFSAFARLRREGILDFKEEDMARNIILSLSDSWTEILPGDEIRIISGRIFLNHPLRAADTMQLAAAIIWADKTPSGHQFVCFDKRLREAARKEGFMVLPEEITIMPE